MENRYNLVDEKWIMSNVGMVSLMDCFTNDEIYTVGGTITQKLCLLKLFFAIGQASNDFDDVDAIAEAGIETVRKNIINYLNEHRDQFWFYGDRPFLQFPKLAEFDKDKYFVEYEINKFDESAASGGNGVYVDTQKKEHYSDSDKAHLLMVLLGSPVKNKIFMGNKKMVQFASSKYIKAAAVKNNAIVSANNSCVGFFCGNRGMLHGFVAGESIMQSVFVNILPNDEIDEIVSSNPYLEEKGVPPWEIEDLHEEHEYKNTYYAYLVPMNRFALFNDSDSMFRCTEGIQYYTPKGSGAELQLDYEFMQSQLDIFVYNVEIIKSKKKSDDKIVKRIAVAPEQRESVLYSLRPFVEYNIGKKTTVYNTMINHSHDLLTEIFGSDRKNWRDYSIEYIGTEYETNNGSTYRIGYVDKTFGYDRMICRDENRLKQIANFIGDGNYDIENPKNDKAYAIINRTIGKLKRFYKQFTKNDEAEFIEKDRFFQMCRCLIRDIEKRAVSSETFDEQAELDKFSRDVNKLAQKEIHIDSCYDRGRKMEIAYNVGLFLG